MTLGELAGRLEDRGFGPILMMLGALVALPTGAIPGMPALVGLVLVLFSVQILIGRRVPWMPRRLAEVSVSRRLLESSLARARPAAKRLGRIARPRLIFLATNKLAQRAIALAVLATALIMIPIGFIPFLPLALGVNVVFFGIGMTTHDGRAILLGYAAFALAAGAAIFNTS